MKLTITSTKRARIEMLPLIDIVFLLLVFFIYAMLSMAVHRALPIALPTSDSAEIEQSELLAITVTKNGNVFFDKDPIEMSALQEVLEEKVRFEKLKGVQVFGDRNVEYQQLFKVLDSIKRAGITEISLQAQKDE